MPPLSDRQRTALAALSFAEQGMGQAAIGAALLARLPGLTAAEVQQAVNDANMLQAAAVGASLAQETDTLGAVVGRPNQTAPLIVEATLTFEKPGKDTQYITLRYDDFMADTTMDEVNERIEQDYELWLDESGEGVTSSSWTLRFIM